MGFLSNTSVVAIEQAVAAPACTMRLAQAGAEVIKIERPGRLCPRIRYGCGGSKQLLCLA